jgi:hypothetical protein
LENKFKYAELPDFDKHISNSIPGYDTLVDLTVSLSNHYINESNRYVVDIGSSTGKLLDKVQRDTNISLPNKFFNVDPADFNSTIINRIVNNVKGTGQYFYENHQEETELCYSLFTLQFCNSSERKELLTAIVNNLHQDGAFFIAEKVYQQQAETQELYSCALRKTKLNSFSGEEIVNKDYELLRSLKLKTEQDLLKELRSYNLTVVKYWQSLHFNAYICTKK